MHDFDNMELTDRHRLKYTCVNCGRIITEPKPARFVVCDCGQSAIVGQNDIAMDSYDDRSVTFLQTDPAGNILEETESLPIGPEAMHLLTKRAIREAQTVIRKLTLQYPDETFFARDDIAPWAKVKIALLLAHSDVFRFLTVSFPQMKDDLFLDAASVTRWPDIYFEPRPELFMDPNDKGRQKLIFFAQAYMPEDGGDDAFRKTVRNFLVHTIDYFLAGYRAREIMDLAYGGIVREDYENMIRHTPVEKEKVLRLIRAMGDRDAESEYQSEAFSNAKTLLAEHFFETVTELKERFRIDFYETHAESTVLKDPFLAAKEADRMLQEKQHNKEYQKKTLEEEWEDFSERYEDLSAKRYTYEYRPGCTIRPLTRARFLEEGLRRLAPGMHLEYPILEARTKSKCCIVLPTTESMIVNGPLSADMQLALNRYLDMMDEAAG